MDYSTESPKEWFIPFLVFLDEKYYTEDYFYSYMYKKYGDYTVNAKAITEELINMGMDNFQTVLSGFTLNGKELAFKVMFFTEKIEIQERANELINEHYGVRQDQLPLFNNLTSNVYAFEFHKEIWIKHLRIVKTNNNNNNGQQASK